MLQRDLLQQNNPIVFVQNEKPHQVWGFSFYSIAFLVHDEILNMIFFPAYFLEMERSIFVIPERAVLLHPEQLDFYRASTHGFPLKDCGNDITICTK